MNINPIDRSVHAIIAQRLKLLREQNNYTQEYVANEIGISQSGYAKIEATGRILVCRLYAICFIYNITLSTFFEGEIFKKLQSI